MRNRRVGTLTLGIILIIGGLLFILKTLDIVTDYRWLLTLWPAILILLGSEVLAFNFSRKEEKLKYDGGAIALLIVLSLITFTLAGAEYILINQIHNIIIR